MRRDDEFFGDQELTLLYIAKKLAELNEAELWFESEEKKGSTFFLSIRLKSAS